MISTDILLNQAILAALEAGELLRLGQLSGFAVTTKEGQYDLVTDYDRKAEGLIKERLSKAFPHHGFLGEEEGVQGPTLENTEGDSIVWIIDPLDGTVNFVHHIPFFCVSLAAVQGGQVLCGVIYNPMTHELFTAQKGRGAYLNGKQLQIKRPQNLQQCLFATGFPYNLQQNPRHCRERLQRILELGTPLRRLGSAALDLAYVAAGRMDAYWEVSVHPWDLAAGVCLVNEAGGKVTQLSGEPMDWRIHDLSVMAIHPELHESFLQQLSSFPGGR